MTGVLPAPATVAPSPPESAGDAGWSYRPALDGLRTVAVYLVVAYHAGVVAFAGGYIGVDLFFVLSGFLVTSVILAEYGSSGRISLGRFYARRVRRLLPAAVVTIVAIAVAAVFIEPPLTRQTQVADAQSALLYVSNWHFVRQATDYFAQDVNTSPYLHFWSLSVEEQFYLGFPLILVGLLALGRRWARPAVTTAGLALLLVASVATQQYWSSRSPLRAYYGTEARVYQMLAGATLAWLLSRPRGRRVVASTPRSARTLAGAVAALGLVLLIAAATDLWAMTPSRRGYVAALVSVTLIAALEFAGAAPVTRLLSLTPIVYLGRISYGIYLWHWPIIVFAHRVIDLSPVALAITAAVGATAMASLSFALLEAPVRTSRRLRTRPWLAVMIGLSASVLAATLIVPPILHSDRPPVVDASGPTVTPVAVPTSVVAPTTVPPTTTTVVAAGAATAAPAAAATTSTVAATSTTVAVPLDQITVPSDIDLAAAASFATGQFTCLDSAPEDCILEHGSGPSVFLLGDSNAAMMVPMFRQLAKDHDFTFAATTAAGCTWQQGLSWQVDDQSLVDACVKTRTDAYERVIPALHPDIIITVHVSRDDPARPSPPFVPLDDSLGTGSEAIANATSQSLDALTATGAKVLLIEPFPYGSFDTVQCLSGVVHVIDCAFQASVDPSPTKVIYRYEALDRPNVFDISFDHLVCPNFPLCLPILDGELVFRDALHVYPPWLVEHRDELWTQMQQTGVFG